MKFLLMMHAPRGDGSWGIDDWPKGTFEAHVAHMKELNNRLRKSSELVDVLGLAPPGEARLVRAGNEGKARVTDGPFAETREFLAGFWMIEVSSADRAHQIAAEASSAPGPDGKPMNLSIEVRQVMDCPPDEIG